ncbi:MAG TPA: Fe-S cluster assembly ATPase SufC [Candidatus Saccharimonadia bacterium]|nr:Fe-S cluster assembly ATPase SufC [Candidatus Saccharimonadia bacterium]
MAKDETLEIIDLHVSLADGKEILRGLSLSVKRGEVHAVMGPNGGGKSTLAAALMGHPAYRITSGSVRVGGADLTTLSPDQRARLGLFLGFQYPVEVAGVNFASFLRQAVNGLKAEGEKKLSPIAFRNQLEEAAKGLGFSEELAARALNVGFSGGEKKKAEILQLAMLRPKFAVLDEPDSGLDVDALRHIGAGVNGLDYPIGLVLITHYQRILGHIKPDFVHVVMKGRLAASGGPELAAQIEQSGYEGFR